jgi:hypothetical protein
MISSAAAAHYSGSFGAVVGVQRSSVLIVGTTRKTSNSIPVPVGDLKINNVYQFIAGCVSGMGTILLNRGQRSIFYHHFEYKDKESSHFREVFTSSSPSTIATFGKGHFLQEIEPAEESIFSFCDGL